MKLRTKEYVVILIVMLDFLSPVPVYESPVIIRQGVNNYNPRIDSINDSSVEKYERYLNNKLKNRLEGEMIGNFSLQNFDKLISMYNAENLDKKTNNQIVEEVGNLLKNSIEIQKYILFTTQAVKKRLGLLDLKLKEIEVIDKQVDLLKTDNEKPEEKSKINSDIIKAKNDRAFEILTSASSLFDLNFNSACQILKVGKDELDSLNSPIKEGESNEETNSFEESKSNEKVEKNEAKKIQSLSQDDDDNLVPKRDQTKLKEGLKELQNTKPEETKAFRFMSKGSKLKGTNTHKRKNYSKHYDH